MSIEQTRSSRLWYLGIVLILAAAAGVVWGNYRFAKMNPGGSEFLSPWLITQAYIFESRSPYSPEDLRGLQADELDNIPEGADIHGSMVYPLYATIVLVPFALIRDFLFARVFWMTFLEACILFLALTTLRLSGWRVPIWLLPVYLLFSLFWFHGFQGVVDGNLAILISLLCAMAIKAVRDGDDLTAGLLLAYATIRPKLVFLLVVFVLLWAASRKRWGLIRWFFIFVLLLIGLGMTFIADWPLQNIGAIIRNPDYLSFAQIGVLFQSWMPGIGTQLKWGLVIFLSLLLIFEWWNAWGKDYNHFLWTACLTLTIGQGIGFTTNPGDMIVLFLPMILIFSIVKERWPLVGDLILLVLMVLIFLGLWTLVLRSPAAGGESLPSAVLFIPITLFSLIGLYWIRWWVLRPTRTVARGV